MKRKHNEVDAQIQTKRPCKRLRQGGKIHLFHLSEELLLRILSYLPVPSLARCEGVCRKFKSLARDNELWREKYYNQFVRHRARRLPSLQVISREEQDSSQLLFSSRAAQWLEHSHLVRSGHGARWKHLYKVKFNWVRGRARTSEVLVDSKPAPAVLARLQNGDLYTADQAHGLRKWKNGAVWSSHTLESDKDPLAMAVETSEGRTFVCVGFSDGLMSIYTAHGHGFSQIAERSSSTVGISSIAMAWPYILSMSASGTIELFLCNPAADGSTVQIQSITNLHTETELFPAALSLRKARGLLVAGVAYAFDRFNTGWCLGLQEIRIDLEGAIVGNRSITSVGAPIRDRMRPPKVSTIMSRSTSAAPFGLHPSFARAPNSLSYCGCYVLAALPDNTLMVYTITSTDDKLEINMGRRLWGHTSAVSAAEVTSTGKALSISAKSEEMRYWELEELLTSSSQRKTSTSIKSVNMLDDTVQKRNDGLGLAFHGLKQEDCLMRRCVSFDDEQAIVVGERGQKQIVSCFSFA